MCVCACACVQVPTSYTRWLLGENEETLVSPIVSGINTRRAGLPCSSTHSYPLNIALYALSDKLTFAGGCLEPGEDVRVGKHVKVCFHCHTSYNKWYRY